MIGVKRHIMAVDLPESECISGAEINGTVLCWNLAENCSKSVLKMCISKHCHDVTGFCSGLEHTE